MDGERVLGWVLRPVLLLILVFYLGVVFYFELGKWGSCPTRQFLVQLVREFHFSYFRGFLICVDSWLITFPAAGVSRRRWLELGWPLATAGGEGGVWLGFL